MPFSTAGRGFNDISSHNNGGGTTNFPGFCVKLVFAFGPGPCLSVSGDLSMWEVLGYWYSASCLTTQQDGSWLCGNQ